MHAQGSGHAREGSEGPWRLPPAAHRLEVKAKAEVTAVPLSVEGTPHPLPHTQATWAKPGRLISSRRLRRLQASPTTKLTEQGPECPRVSDSVGSREPVPRAKWAREGGSGGTSCDHRLGRRVWFSKKPHYRIPNARSEQQR